MPMSSPVKGRVSSEYGRRAPIPGVAPAPFHAGIDIAAPVGTPVHAAFAGTVIKEGAGVAPGRSGDRNVLIANPDGEGQYYGHLDSNVVKVGQKVAAGEVIGYVGARGNVTGPHLHFEVWRDAHNPGSTRDPRIDFRAFGIAPGAEPVKAPKPKPTPAPKPRTTLKRGMTGEDVKDLQRALNRFKATPDKRWPNGDLRVDGDYGPYTEARVRDLQHRNGLFVDGIAGPITRRFLGLA